MTDDEVLAEFGRLFREFIPNDIRRSLDDAKANYLAALGLLSYTEILGGFLSGQGARPGYAASNFKAALNRFPDAYRVVDESLSVRDEDGRIQTGLYAVVRCGLVHEYGVKGPSIVYSSSDGVARDGRQGVSISQDDGKRIVEINCHEYLRDFCAAIELVWGQLESKQEPLISNVRLVLERLDAYTVL